MEFIILFLTDNGLFVHIQNNFTILTFEGFLSVRIRSYVFRSGFRLEILLIY